MQPPPEDKVATPSGQGTLNINSTPVSNVILDGKPLGATPKGGLKVSAGPHTVVFAPRARPQGAQRHRSTERNRDRRSALSVS